MSNKNIGTCLACRTSIPPLYRSQVDNNLYCVRHYNQMRTHGKITSIPKISGAFKPNQAFKKGDDVEIVLVDRKGNEVGRTVVEAADYGKVVAYRWYMSRRGYVRTKFMREGENKRARMHSLLIGKKKGYVTDHIDGDTLNNRRSNLRHVTNEQNQWNSAQIKNYTSYKLKDKFICSFKYKGQTITLGKWDTREEAIELARKFQMFLHGEYGYDKSRKRT